MRRLTTRPRQAPRPVKEPTRRVAVRLENIADRVVSPGDFRYTLRERWEQARAEAASKEIDDMARKITTVLKTSVAPAVKLVDVPADVRDELEQLYKHLRDNPTEEGIADFDTVEEKNEFIAQAKSWAVGEEVRYRTLRPIAGAPDTQLHFIVSPPLTEEEKEANRIANAKSKAKREAKAAEEAAKAKK